MYPLCLIITIKLLCKPKQIKKQTIQYIFLINIQIHYSRYNVNHDISQQHYLYDQGKKANHKCSLCGRNWIDTPAYLEEPHPQVITSIIKLKLPEDVGFDWITNF